MTTTFLPRLFDPEIRRYDALRALLAQADPIDLPTRARRYTYAGDPARRDRLKRDLEYAYLRHRMVEAGEDAEIVCVRRASLRLVKSA